MSEPVDESVLQEAARLIDGARNQDYGHPYDDFSGTAKIWSAILETDVEPWQVAACMIGVKLSRLRKSPDKRDHWVDIAGYAGTAEKVAERTGGLR